MFLFLGENIKKNDAELFSTYTFKTFSPKFPLFNYSKVPISQLDMCTHSETSIGLTSIYINEFFQVNVTSDFLSNYTFHHTM